MSQRQLIHEWALGRPRGFTAKAIAKLLDITRVAATQQLKFMVKQGNLRSVSEKVTLTKSGYRRCRYFAIAGKPPVGIGRYERKPNIGKIYIKVDAGNRYRMRAFNLECLPLVRAQ